MLQEIDSKRVEEFFAGIAPWEAAYEHAGLSYFAAKHEGAFVLVQGRLFLRMTPPNTQATHFQSDNIRVGHYKLKELGATSREVVANILNGVLSTPHGELCFPPGHAGYYSVGYVPFHHEGQQSGNRLGVLTLAGAQCAPYNLDDVVAELLVGLARIARTALRFHDGYHFTAGGIQAIVGYPVPRLGVVAVDRYLK